MAEGAVGEDAVGVVGEDVVFCGVEGGGGVEFEREVGGVEFPEGEAAEERAAPVGGGTVDVCGGEEDVDEVGDQDGPGEGDGEEEPEEGDPERDGEFVEKDGSGLEASFQWDVEWGDADSGGVSRVLGGGDGKGQTCGFGVEGWEGGFGCCRRWTFRRSLLGCFFDGGYEGA